MDMRAIEKFKGKYIIYIGERGILDGGWGMKRWLDGHKDWKLINKIDLPEKEWRHGYCHQRRLEIFEREIGRAS